MSERTGDNDWKGQPAPSGREDHPVLRLPSLPKRPEIWVRIMSESILADEVSRYRRRALYTFFCGEGPSEWGDYEGQLEAVGRCLEWFVFDYRMGSAGLTPAEQWLGRWGPDLDEQTSTDAQDCLDFMLGLFEIVKVRSSEGFWVYDLLRGQEYCVSDEVLSGETQEGQLLIGRLFPHRQSYALSGMATLMYPTATRQIKYLIKDGDLQPDFILRNIDGIELENLLGDRLQEIEGPKDEAVLGRRLQRYFEVTCPGCMRFEDVMALVRREQDPDTAAREVCERMQIECRHEKDLIETYLQEAWSKAHHK